MSIILLGFLLSVALLIPLTFELIFDRKLFKCLNVFYRSLVILAYVMVTVAGSLAFYAGIVATY